MNVHKRRRVSTKCKQPKDLSQTNFDKTYQRYTLDTLPPEVLEMVLRLLPLRDVACAVRLVSRHCSIIATIVLNGAFIAAGAKVESVMKHVQTIMRNVKTDTELLAFSRTFNALELIRVQYKMLKAVTWRYTHPPNKYKFPRLCFYAGSLLDELNDLLNRAAKYPTTFIGSHALDSSVACFIAVCKRFMNFFEKVSERRVNRSALVSGCKVVDVLDCLIEGRQVLAFKVSTNQGVRGDIVSMRLKYVMKRAWFTCLDVPKSTDEHSWRDEQRFMYLRLRRLVGSVNEHLFENLHYENELLLQVPLTLSLRPPPASTYSGYGEYGGKFFYYGNMNKYAYESKFMDADDLINGTIETEEELQKTPCFDLAIEVEFRCSSELAPLAVRTVLKSDQFDSFVTKQPRHQELFLKMNIKCPASMANRLPDSFVWEVQSPQHIHHMS